MATNEKFFAPAVTLDYVAKWFACGRSILRLPWNGDVLLPTMDAKNPGTKALHALRCSAVALENALETGRLRYSDEHPGRACYTMFLDAFSTDEDVEDVIRTMGKHALRHWGIADPMQGSVVPSGIAAPLRVELATHGLYAEPVHHVRTATALLLAAAGMRDPRDSGILASLWCVDDAAWLLARKNPTMITTAGDAQHGPDIEVPRDVLGDGNAIKRAQQDASDLSHGNSDVLTNWAFAGRAHGPIERAAAARQAYEIIMDKPDAD